MEPAYHIATDDGLISIQVGSDIDLAEFYDLTKALLASPDYDAELPMVADLRGMQLNWNRRAAKPFSKYVIDRFRNRPGSMAVVIDPDLDSQLTAGIYWLVCAVGGTEVFDDYDHAMKWLIRKEFANVTPPGVADLTEPVAAT